LSLYSVVYGGFTEKEILKVVMLLSKENAAINQETRQRGGLGGTYNSVAAFKNPVSRE